MTITLTPAELVRIAAKYPTHPYEVQNDLLADLADQVETLLNDMFATQLAAEHWDADDQPMLETGPEVLAAIYEPLPSEETP